MSSEREIPDDELPADLELLGQQLGDDAQRLASLYPPSGWQGNSRLAGLYTATEEAAWSTLPPRRTRRFSRVAIVALASLASVLLACGIYFSWHDANDRTDAMPARVAERAALAPDAAPASAMSAAPPVSFERKAEGEIGIEERDEWLRGLTGPELEGVLDLIEPRAAELSVSI